MRRPLILCLVHCTVLVFTLAGLGVAQERAEQGASASVRPIVWARADRYIAGTPASRVRALARLGATRGRWVVIYVTLDCGDCERAAKLLDRYVGVEPQILGVAVGSADEVKEWRDRVGLRYAVTGVDSATFEDLGAVILPTIVWYQNGRARGARAPSTERNWK